jgi:hypothetical protein
MKFLDMHGAEWRFNGLKSLAHKSNNQITRILLREAGSLLHASSVASRRNKRQAYGKEV